MLKMVSAKEEIWKDIKGYEGYYKVSNLGRVKSLDRTIEYKNGIEYTLKGSLRIISCSGTGYQNIGLSRDSVMKNFLVHRLVAVAFLNNPDSLPVVNHIDGDKTNNKVCNLEWASHSDNMGHAVDTGLRETSGVKNEDTKNKMSNVTVKEKVENILSVFPNMSNKDIADIVDSTPKYVYRVRRMVNMTKDELADYYRNKNKSRRKKAREKSKKESTGVIDGAGEVWKRVLGYEDSYEVSNYGRIKSLSRKIEVHRDGETHVRYYRERLMSPSIRARYPNVNLSSDGRPENFSIHRLVAQAFIPNPENKPYVNHIDGDTHNNHVSNLEWVTQSENINHAIKIGNKEPKEAKVNPKKPTTNKQKIFDVLNRFPDMKTGKIAELVGCNPRYVTKIRVIWNKM